MLMLGDERSGDVREYGIGSDNPLVDQACKCDIQFSIRDPAAGKGHTVPVSD